MRNFSKFSKAVLKTTVLLGLLPFVNAFASGALDAPEIPGFPYPPAPACKAESKLKIIHPTDPHSAALKVGESLEWVIGNASLQHAACNIRLFSELADSGKITVENHCEATPLKPGKTCKIKTTAIENGEGKVEFEGRNTPPVEGFLKIEGGSELVIGAGDDSCFTINENHSKIELANLGHSAITFASGDVHFEGLEDVKVGEYHLGTADECKLSLGKWTVPAGAANSCFLPLDAGRKAHNISDADGKIFIKYGSPAKESQACVNVSKVEISINGGEPIDVPTGNFGRKEIVVENESEFFSWQHAEIDFDPGTTQHVTIDVRECRFEAESDEHTVAPGDCLIVTFQATDSGEHGTGTLFARGSNITPNPTSEEVNVGDVTITLASPDEQYLQAQKIRVSNNFATGPVHLESVTWSNLDGDLKICGEFDFTCPSRSTCAFNKPIAPGESCHIVLMGTTNPSQNLNVKEGVVHVKVRSDATETKKEWIADFHANKETSLYVTGAFNRAGKTVEAYNIAKWNGENWSNLARGLKGEGRALALFQGNLHVGGIFANADSVPNTAQLAKWNGVTWSQLGTEPYLAPNREVNTLFVHDNQLSVGGNFTMVDGVAASRIALWTGTAWTALGGLANNGTDGPIHDIASHLGGLYFAGDFDRVGVPRNNGKPSRTKAHNVVGFVGLDWVLLGHRFFNGTNREAYSLFTASDNDLYVAGAFTKSFGNRKFKPPYMPVTRTNHVAKWTGAKWEAVGKNHHAINGTIRDVTSFQDTLFIGGSFNSNLEGLKYVAFLNGATGNWVQAGVAIDGTVNQLLPTPSVMYAGGHFGASGGLFNNIAYLDRVNQSTNWKPIDFDGGGVTSTYPREVARVKSMLVADSLTLRRHGE
jgi:hypothetical protein